MRMSIVIALVLAQALSGCSVYMASSGEKKRDIDLLAPGVDRSAILAEFGTPVATVREEIPIAPAAEPDGAPLTDDDAATDPAAEAPPTNEESGVVIAAAPAPIPTELRHYDVFRFVQGRSTASNAGRAVLYGTAAFFTLGLSEILTTPIEGSVGDVGEIRLRTNYDRREKLTHAEVLGPDGEWLPVDEWRTKAAEAEARRAAEAD